VLHGEAFGVVRAVGVVSVVVVVGLRFRMLTIVGWTC